MSHRKYSVAEIDVMRRSVHVLIASNEIATASAEDWLRTYMLNGTDPEELVDAAEQAHAAALAREREDEDA